MRVGAEKKVDLGLSSGGSNRGTGKAVPPTFQIAPCVPQVQTVQMWVVCNVGAC